MAMANIPRSREKHELPQHRKALRTISVSQRVSKPYPSASNWARNSTQLKISPLKTTTTSRSGLKQRLISVLQINDAQASRAQRDLLRAKSSLMVRSPVGKGL